jgi:hypothetical protein
MKCDITRKIFYHPRVERTQWFKEVGVAEEQEPMPRECKLYDKIYNSVEELLQKCHFESK